MEAPPIFKPLRCNNWGNLACILKGRRSFYPKTSSKSLESRKECLAFFSSCFWLLIDKTAAALSNSQFNNTLQAKNFG